MQEGNDVRYSIAAPEAQTVGDGLIEKATSFTSSVQWSDIVIFDSNVEMLPDEAERVKFSRPTLGTGKLAQKLEDDRLFGIKFAKEGGLEVPNVKEFKGPRAWQQAREFLSGRPKNEAWVWKPNGEAPVATYVASDLDEMYRMMRYWKSLYDIGGEQPWFVLTPKIEGQEISTEAWFNGREFFCHNQTLERNRFFDHDHGEKTGCCGNVVFLTGPDRLFETLLYPLTGQLAGKYIGPIDVNAIIEEESNIPVFLEFTPRFGYDAVFALMELVEDFGSFLYAIATGQRPTVAPPKKDFAGAVRMHIPPYPEPPEGDDDTRAIGVPIFGWDPDKQSRHIHPIEVRLDIDGEPETSGPDGYVMVASDLGDTVEDAMRAAYKQVEDVKIPNVRYRGDLTEAISEVYDKITATGWLEHSQVATPIEIFGRGRTYGYGRHR